MKKTPKKDRRTKKLGPQKVPHPAMTHGLRAKIDINGIDGRTRLGKVIAILRNELRDFVGEPTPVSELLIQRIVYKGIKLGLYESHCLNDLKNIEADHYLPMSNSFRLDLQSLAQLAGKSKAPSYEEIMKRLEAKT